jgi:hypothetical protein
MGHVRLLLNEADVSIAALRLSQQSKHHHFDLVRAFMDWVCLLGVRCNHSGRLPDASTLQ